MSATRATHAAQRYTARLAFLSRDRFAIAQQSPRTRSRVESEFAAYSEHGIEDFEDLYADGFEASDDEDDTSVQDTSALIDDVTGYDGDDVDRDDVFVESALGGRVGDGGDDSDGAQQQHSGKLQCFVEWDFMTRGEWLVGIWTCDRYDQIWGVLLYRW